MLWISLLILRMNSGLWKRISHCWNIPWDDSSVLSNSTWWAFVVFLPGTLSFDFASTIEKAKLHWKFCFLCCGRFASENALTFPNLERDTRPIWIRFPVSLALKPWQSATKSETPRQNIPVCSSTLTKLLVSFCDLASRSCSAVLSQGTGTLALQFSLYMLPRNSLFASVFPQSFYGLQLIILTSSRQLLIIVRGFQCDMLLLMDPLMSYR